MNDNISATISETTKAWAAGIFDGEGSALIPDSGTGLCSIKVGVVNTDRRVIEVIEKNWVNSPDEYSFRRYGRYTMVFYDKPTRGTNSRPHSFIQFDYADAEHFLLDIRPYLVAKVEETEIIIRAIGSLRDPANFYLAWGKILWPFRNELIALGKGRLGVTKELSVDMYREKASNNYDKWRHTTRPSKRVNKELVDNFYSNLKKNLSPVD